MAGGHDLNYIALSGVLSLLPGEGIPSFPLNLLADFAGGGLVCVLGILIALISRGQTGCGQVVQTDMVSGSRYISSFPLLHSALETPFWDKPRGDNVLDGGAPFYSVYKCAHDSSGPQYITVASLEPQFFKEFIHVFKRHVPIKRNSPLVGLSDERLHTDRSVWPDLRTYLGEGFAQKTRNDWADIFKGTDACTVPVLTPFEAAQTAYEGDMNPLPHPSLSQTPAIPPSRASESLRPGRHAQEILEEYGIRPEERCRLIEQKIVEVFAVSSPTFKL